jgi:hypothetical protein
VYPVEVLIPKITTVKKWYVRRGELLCFLIWHTEYSIPWNCALEPGIGVHGRNKYSSGSWGARVSRSLRNFMGVSFSEASYLRYFGWMLTALHIKLECSRIRKFSRYLVDARCFVSSVKILQAKWNTSSTHYILNFILEYPGSNCTPHISWYSSLAHTHRQWSPNSWAHHTARQMSIHFHFPSHNYVG